MTNSLESHFKCYERLIMECFVEDVMLSACLMELQRVFISREADIHSVMLYLSSHPILDNSVTIHSSFESILQLFVAFLNLKKRHNKVVNLNHSYKKKLAKMSFKITFNVLRATSKRVN